MQTWQDKMHDPDMNTEVAEPIHKATTNTAAATHIPAWANAGGEHVPAGLQAKLTINQPGDVYEQEADRMAEQVMRMPMGGTSGTREDMPVMRKESNGGQASHDAPPVVQQALSGGGQPLDAGVKTSMEARFGQDFSHVRVHADGQAGESAQAIHARAYTVGSDVVFGEGQYQPGMGEGQRLLAHELTHVVQQRSGVGAQVQKWDSPEHAELGEQAGGVDTGLIVLECHNKDLPQRLQPINTWPANWQKYYASATAGQKRAITQGLTYGEVIALSGDFYAGFDALNHAPLRELIDLIPLIRASATTTQLQEATGGRYLALARKNESHFSNVTVGHRNIDFWRDMHSQSIQAARQGNANMAWGLNAAADHYLTDAFSGGHIRTPRSQLMGSIPGDIESKILHNLDNEHGVEVTNRRGDSPWIAYGDDMLKDPRNVRNKELAMEAVRLSKQDIADALSQKASYPVPSPKTVFNAELLVPYPINPTRDRWTGRTPTYIVGPDGNPVRVADDYTMTRDRIIASEGPGVLAGFFNDDDQIRTWVAKQDLAAVGRQPAPEKIRMINTLLDGWVSDDDLDAIDRICRSVTSFQGMVAIQNAISPLEISLTSIGQRTRLRVILSRHP